MPALLYSRSAAAWSASARGWVALPVRSHDGAGPHAGRPRRPWRGSRWRRAARGACRQARSRGEAAGPGVGAGDPAALHQGRQGVADRAGGPAAQGAGDLARGEGLGEVLGQVGEDHGAQLARAEATRSGSPGGATGGHRAPPLTCADPKPCRGIPRPARPPQGGCLARRLRPRALWRAVGAVPAIAVRLQPMATGRPGRPDGAAPGLVAIASLAGTRPGCCAPRL